MASWCGGEAGLTVVEAVAAAAIAAVVAGALAGLYLASSRGVAAIHTVGTFQMTLTQAMDQIRRDVQAASRAVAAFSSGEVTWLADSESASDGTARWILELPTQDHVIYEYQASTGALERLFVPAGGPTVTRVAANGLRRVAFQRCDGAAPAPDPPEAGADPAPARLSQCVEVLLQCAQQPSVDSTPSLAVRAVYRNPS